MPAAVGALTTRSFRGRSGSTNSFEVRTAPQVRGLCESRQPREPTDSLSAHPTSGTRGAQHLHRPWARWYGLRSGQFTQRDPIGLNGGINQYGYAAGDPIGRSDPFGLDVDVACRELHSPGIAKVAQHCAVRVTTEKGDTIVYELLQRGGLNHSAVANAEAAAEYDGRWVPVERPAGSTRAQFDKAVMDAAAHFINETKGRPYHFTGGRNSNRFVFSIITTSGALPPDAARRRSGGLDQAPGLCGGANFSTGIACARTP